MSESYPCARFWRRALPVKPANYHGTFRGVDHGLTEEAYNQALLQHCQELDIRVVGMADHRSVTSIDVARELLAPAGIVVFPGFEIASNDKTHYVCLFAEDTTSQTLERYLGRLQLLAPEDGVRPSRLSSEQLIEAVVDQIGGFIHAAHRTEKCGLSKQRLNHVWQLPKLRAAQIELNVNAGEGSPVYRSLERLSTGQQCTAILHLLPLDNRDPLVMDQQRTISTTPSSPSASCVSFARPRRGGSSLSPRTTPTFPCLATPSGLACSQQRMPTAGADAQGSIDVLAIRDSVATIPEGARAAFMRRKARYEL